MQNPPSPWQPSWIWQPFWKIVPFKSGDLGTQANKNEDFSDSIKIKLDLIFTGANSYNVTPSDSLVKTEIVNGELVVTSASDSNASNPYILNPYEGDICWAPKQARTYSSGQSSQLMKTNE